MVRAGRLQRAACIMITEAMRTTPTKVLEMFLDLPTLGMAVEFTAPISTYLLPRPNTKNLEIGHNQIWAKADKMDNKFSMIKDYVTLRRMLGKYWTVIPTREEWYKYWPSWLRKGQVWFTDGACNQQGTGPGICKYQSKIQWHISLGQDATAFLSGRGCGNTGLCDSSCLRKILMKEQITIYTDSQAAVAALAASGTKSLLVTDCIEKLTVLSEVNQVTIMCVPGHGGIQQNETVDRLVREGARTRPIGPEPFLPLSLNRFRYKIRNWIEKRKQTEWEVCEKYGTN